MGGGNPVKKAFKSAEKFVKDPKRVAAATVSFGSSEIDRAATGGAISEPLTGGVLESKQTKALKDAANKAEAEQAGIIQKQSDEVDEKAKARELRRIQQALGKRSLLFQGQGGSELGVAPKKTTLG